MFTKNMVTLVCGGDKQYHSPHEVYVYVSPLTAWKAVGLDNPSILLGDYSPNEQTAKAADESLYFQIETCLQQEAEADFKRRWWPLAYRRLMARLSRYRWYKWCLREIVKEHRALILRLTSGEDKDLVMAARAIGGEMGISIEVLTGKADPPLNIDHMIRQTGLALRIDPTWLTSLQQYIWKLYSSRETVTYQPYWNLKLDRTKNCSPIFINRIVSIMETIIIKINQLKIIKKRNSPIYYDLWAQDVIPENLCAKEWTKYFSSDENKLIAQILGTFIKEYPSSDIDRAGKALKEYLRKKSVRSVILMHDKLDSCRLLAWAAHEVGAIVNYLPHGIIFEDAAGQKSNSSFSPDRILSWNATSAETAKKYGWCAEAVAHPHFDRPIRPFKILKKNWEKTKVLVMLADWVYLTGAGREDCTWVWCREILDALNKVGIDDENIYIKMHQFNEDATLHYKNIMEELSSILNFKPRWVPQDSRISDILPSFDLVICGITTGIYECAMYGIPHIVYGMSAKRVGVLRRINVPQASNTQELLMCIENYDNDQSAHDSEDLWVSLNEGIDIEVACLDFQTLRS